jgi:hypothetical protein
MVENALGRPALNRPETFMTPRSTNDQVAAAVQIARRLLPERIIILSIHPERQRMPGTHIRTIAAPSEAEDVIAANSKRAVFVLDFDTDEDFEIAAGICMSHSAKYVCPPARMSRYSDWSNATRRTMANQWEAAARDNITHFNSPDFCNLMQLIDLTKNLPGDYVEVGVLNGASARLALHYMTEIKVSRQCFFYDTFSGWDYDATTESSDAHWSAMGYGLSHGFAVVRDRLMAYNTETLNVTVEVRNIIDGLPANMKQVVIANIDVDLYEAVRAAITAFAPVMVRGGVMVVEDSGHAPRVIGARIAVNDFLKSNSDFLHIFMESGQSLLIRR